MIRANCLASKIYLKASISHPSLLSLSVSKQNVYYTSSQQLHLGVLSPTIDDDDNKCLVDVNSRPRLLECSYAATKHMRLTWAFTQVKHSEWTAVVNESCDLHNQKLLLGVVLGCFTHFSSLALMHL